MNKDDFEQILDAACKALTTECRAGVQFNGSPEFERRVREVIDDLLGGDELKVDFNPHPHVFPDIALGEFGVEVKFTKGDSWRSVANSILQSTRDENIVHIYIVYGKMGGEPTAAWGRYEDCVMHVRTSHVPRFEVDIKAKESLFTKMGVTYEEFSSLPMAGKMQHIRVYARGRLKPGDRLWWLDDHPDPDHALELQVRLFPSLSQQEKRQLRAEAALLCPQIVKPSRSKHKYDDAALFALTYHGILCFQARDLFSAGSVALRGDDERGGRYIERALIDIEDEMKVAANSLEDALFVEYWGVSVPPERRIHDWLRKVDEHAAGEWLPSEALFKDG